MDWIDQVIEKFLSRGGWGGDAFFKLFLAAVLGGLVGLEREVRGRQAGFRTNLLVCLGSALTMVVSAALAEKKWSADGDFSVTVDPGRIAYGVMTGVGFLGAGAILKHESQIRGLTTAAGLWCVAAIGLAVGMSLYALAIVAAGLVVLALWVLDHFEEILPKRHFRHVTVRLPWNASSLADLVGRFEKHGVGVTARSFRRTDDLAYADVRLSITFLDKKNYAALEADLQKDEQCQLMASEPS